MRLATKTWKMPLGKRTRPDIKLNIAATRIQRAWRANRARAGVSQAIAAIRAGRLNRRGVASVESGFVDLAQNNYALDTTGAIVLLATVAQGASVNQRVGKKIVWKSLQCRGSIYANTAGVFSDVAVLIVYDKRPTGALPAITDILVSASSESFNNDANSGRFEILKRWDTSIIGNGTAPATGMEMKSADFFLDLRRRPCTFKAAGTGAIGDIEEGALYLITVGSNAAGTGASTASLGFRTRFVDV